MSNKSSAVNILAALGVFWDVSNTIMGIMILAPANSIGDYVADTALARSGKGVTAFGAVYSGPLLNLLIGVGLSCTIANIANNKRVPLIRGPHLKETISKSCKYCYFF